MSHTQANTSPSGPLMWPIYLLTIAVASALAGCCRHSTVPFSATCGTISEDFLFLLDRVEHAHADIDHDGTPEWFLGNPATRGQAGLTFLVLKRDGGNWRPLGEIFLHPLAFRILPLASDGSIRLLRYYRTGGSEGTADTMTWRNGEFVVIATEEIHVDDSDEGRRRFDKLFPDPGERLQLEHDQMSEMR